MEELALIYRAKGLDPEQARATAERIISGGGEAALDTLVREELAIDPKELGGSAWEAALTSFGLFSLGAILPVLPYVFFAGTAGILASSAASVVGLFAIGALTTLMTGKNPVLYGLRHGPEDPCLSLRRDSRRIFAARMGNTILPRTRRAPRPNSCGEERTSPRKNARSPAGKPPPVPASPGTGPRAARRRELRAGNPSGDDRDGGGVGSSRRRRSAHDRRR